MRGNEQHFLPTAVISGSRRADGATQFLSKATRSAIADVAAGLVASDVRRVFTDQGFIDSSLLVTRRNPVSGGKAESFLAALENWGMVSNPRLLVGAYLDAVNWTSPPQTLAALSAVEDLLWLFEQTGDREEDWDPLPGDRLRRQLDKDGFRIDDRGRIHPPAHLFITGSLSSLRDPALIRQVLRRIVHALPDDPMQSIGSAKELVEGTSKAVLLQRGQAIPKQADLPKLVRMAEKALGLQPSGVDTSLEGGLFLRSLLGKLTGVTNDLAALRNLHGTGHAPAVLPQGLMPYHGRLAVAAADAWCTFILDVLAEQATPPAPTI